MTNVENIIKKLHEEKKKKRDYDKEYRDYHGSPEQIKNRSKRNKARKIQKLKNGDGKEVDHIKPLSKKGSNKPSNLRSVSRKTNRKKGNKEGDTINE